MPGCGNGDDDPTETGIGNWPTDIKITMTKLENGHLTIKIEPVPGKTDDIDGFSVKFHDSDKQPIEGEGQEEGMNPDHEGEQLNDTNGRTIGVTMPGGTTPPEGTNDHEIDAPADASYITIQGVSWAVGQGYAKSFRDVKKIQ